jgi:hypothetical protein
MRGVFLAVISLIILMGIDGPRLPESPRVKDRVEDKGSERPCVVEVERGSPVKTRCQVPDGPLREGYCNSKRLASLSLERVKSISYRRWKGEPVRGTYHRFLPVQVEATLKDGEVICIRGGPLKWKTGKGTYFAFFYADVTEIREGGISRETPAGGTVTKVTFSPERKNMNLDFWPFNMRKKEEK